MSTITDQSARQDSAAPVPPAIELRGISKAFGPVQANKDISITVQRGTIHGIVGENGAGKSTLMSILYGFYKADAGEVYINGRKTEIPDSLAAIRAGIGMVFQHFKLVENFTVLENVILGAEDSALLRTSRRRARGVLKQLASDFELEVNPETLIEDLSVGHQQRVEILKALYREADILILDEPTGVLTPSEADHLFRILRGLKEQGKTIILITHKLREIMDVTDDVSVMRRGEMVATRKTADTSPTELAELMVGRKVLLRVEKKPRRSPATKCCAWMGCGWSTAKAWNGCARSGFPSARAKFLALPAWPGMASRNCWKCWPVCARPKGRHGCAANRCRCPGQSATGRRGARGALPMSQRIATGAGWCCRFTRGKTPHLVTITIRATIPARGGWMAQRSLPTPPPRWNGLMCARPIRTCPPKGFQAATSKRSCWRAKSNTARICCWSASPRAGSILVRSNSSINA